MNSVYYWLQNKFELDYLRELFKESKCRGFYVPFRFFKNEKTKDAIKESLKILNKEIILYFNYNNELRPDLRSNAQIMGKKALSNKDKEKRLKLIEKKKKKLQFLKTLIKLEEAEHYIDEIYNNFLDLKKFLNKPIEKESDIDELFFDVIKPELKIMDFEYPFITTPPKTIKSEKEGAELYNLIETVNDNFFQIMYKKKEFSNSIFNLCLSIEDLKNKTENYKRALDISRDLEKISLWIINFNEIYASKTEIKLIYDLIRNIYNKNKIFIIKFAGVFTNQLINSIGTNIHSIVRLNGYPGQNINLLAIIQRTRRLVDPINGNYLSRVNIAELFGKQFSCPCEICGANRIKTYKNAYELYLSDDAEENNYYKKYIGKAEKTKHTKIRRIQNRFLLKHCFENIDYNLNLSLENFRLKFSDKAKNFSLWDELYSIGCE